MRRYFLIAKDTVLFRLLCIYLDIRSVLTCKEINPKMELVWSHLFYVVSIESKHRKEEKIWRKVADCFTVCALAIKTNAKEIRSNHNLLCRKERKLFLISFQHFCLFDGVGLLFNIANKYPF